MLVPMTPVQILARRDQLPAVIAELHRQGSMQLTGTAREDLGLAPAEPGPGGTRRLTDLGTEAADLDALLELAATAAAVRAGQDWLRPVTLAVPQPRRDRLAPGLTGRLNRIEALQAEYESARRYHDALAVLLPLEPELALLTESDLARLGLATVVLVIEAPHAGVLDTIATSLNAISGGRSHLAGAQTGEQTVGCVLVLPRSVSAELRTLLSREHVRHVPLGEAYERLSLAHAFTELGHRVAALPGELAEAWSALGGRTGELAPGWRRRRRAAGDEQDHLEAAMLAGASERTAALTGWLPQPEVGKLRNMPVAAREASIYTGITIAEYYRDQGRHVALLTDSTSRWGEALREISSRLEEMPAEEGYPAYLATRLAGFYERAGAVVCQGRDQRRGSVTIVGAVSPPGGDFSEPITQHTLRMAGTFWALDRDLARARAFPAVDWRRSYTLYRLSGWFSREVAASWPEQRGWALDLLQQETSLLEIVQLLGADTLPAPQQVVLRTGQLLREDFLQQSSFDETDAYCPLQKQHAVLALIRAAHEAMTAAVTAGAPPAAVTGLPLLGEIAQARGWPPGEAAERAGRLSRDIAGRLAALEGERP